MIVKICGITRVDDALHALREGADWIGLNLVSGPRRLTLDRAIEVVERVANPSAIVVLVYLRGGGLEDPAVSAVLRAGVRRLQVYGNVHAATFRFARERQIELIYVQPVENGSFLAELDGFLDACGTAMPAYVLFDAARDRTGVLGGTGRRADWDAIRLARQSKRNAPWPPFLLAGGLTPENAASAIAQLDPAGVDVSSGVEQSPGVKDPRKVSALIAAAKGANRPEPLG